MALLPQQQLAPQFDPLRELEDFRERMRGMLERTFTGLPEAVAAAWSPLADVEETDDAYLLEIDLPGLRRQEVSVEVEGNELVVSGEIKERDRQGVLRRHARPTGRFEYRLGLSQKIDPDRIEAGLSDGVLTLRAPKAERGRRRKIEVKSSVPKTPARRTTPSRRTSR
jgi:HSP20 family protein